jgi:hypothetical protein
MSDGDQDHGAPDVASWQDRAETAEASLAALEREMRVRLLRADLRVEAVRAGMIDLDGLQLIDPSVVGPDPKPGSTDPAAIIDELKRHKPWLFAQHSSSSTASVPRPDPPRQKNARDMNVDEWRAARTALLRRS